MVSMILEDKATITKEGEQHKFNVGATFMHDITEAQRDDVHGDITNMEATAATNLTTEGKAAMEAAQQAKKDAATTALTNIA